MRQNRNFFYNSCSPLRKCIFDVTLLNRLFCPVLILASAAKKREIVESLFSGNLAVANRVLEQAVAWQTERGRMRLAMKLVIKILESLLQGPRLPNPLKKHPI